MGCGRTVQSCVMNCAGPVKLGLLYELWVLYNTGLGVVGGGGGVRGLITQSRYIGQPTWGWRGGGGTAPERAQ